MKRDVKPFISPLSGNVYNFELIKDRCDIAEGVIVCERSPGEYLVDFGHSSDIVYVDDISEKDLPLNKGDKVCIISGLVYNIWNGWPCGRYRIYMVEVSKKEVHSNGNQV
jgi:hypothetical protein